MNVNNGCQVAQRGGTKSQGLAIPWHIVAKLIHSSFEFLPLKTGATSPVLTTWCFLRNDMFHLETKKKLWKISSAPFEAENWPVPQRADLEVIL